MDNACSGYSYFSAAGYVCSLVQGAIKGTGIDVSAENVQKIAGEVFNGLAKAVSEGGGELGAGVNEGSMNFLDKADLGNIFSRGGSDLGGGINSGASEFLNRANFGDMAGKFANSAKDAADTSGPIFEGIGMEQIDRAGRLAWSALKTYLPITITSMVATSGVYYGIQYLYKKAEDSIGKPKLATEVRYYNLASRISDAVTTTATNFFKVAIPGVYAATYAKFALTGTPALEPLITKISPKAAAYIPSWLTDFAAGIVSDLSAVRDSRDNPGWHMFPNLKNAFSVRPLGVRGYWDDSFTSLPSLQLADRISIGIGALAAGGVAYSIYQAYKKSIKEEPKAIFNTEIKEVIDDVTHSAYNIQNNKGFFENLLLYGPGGTGKTMIAKLIAKNSGMNYVMMSGGDLAQYIKRKEHVTELNKLIDRSKNSQYPTILFIDEAESLARDRDLMQSPEHVELLNAFLNHTGEASKKLMIIMATNRLEDIDPAVLSRMDHKVNIAPPAPLERKQILQQYIVKFFSDAEQKEFFTEEKVDEVSTKIEGFTGRAVFKMLNAIVGKKNATKENKLTNEIIDKVVDRFIAQEKEVIRLRTKEKLIAAIPEAVAVAVEPSFSERIKNFFNKTFKSNKLEENDMVVTEAPVADVPEVVAVPVASSYSEKMMTFFNDTFKAKV